MNKMSSLHMTLDDWQRSIPAWICGTLIGFPFGSIPAGGAEIPTFLSYAAERKLSKHPEDFAPAKGRGAIEGVAGPEAANNASSTGALAHWRTGATFDTRHSHFGNSSSATGRISKLQLATRTSALHDFR
jgi:TctA family transporter